MDPVRFTISEENHFEFVKLHFWQNLRRLWWVMAALILGLALTYGMIWNLYAGLIMMGLAVATSIPLLSLIRLILLPWHSRRNWKDFALIREEVEFSADGAGFSLVQKSAHVDALWDNMITWAENARILTIYVTRQQAYILTKDEIPSDQIDGVRSCLIASVLAKAGARRR